VEFSPVLLARLFIEFQLGIPRKAVGDYVKSPEKISDERLYVVFSS